MEAMLSSAYSRPADPRFGKLLGQRLMEKANALYLEKALGRVAADGSIAKHSKATGFGALLKWQFAFLSAMVAVLVIGGGTVMAIPSLREKVLEAIKPRGTVSITSDPATAEIWVGPVSYGETPTDIRLPEGDHEIAIKKEGFADATEEITVTAGKIVSYRGVLIENENEMKYSRDEAWNLYQDPQGLYSMRFPYDWEYDWDPYDENGLSASTVMFTVGETLYAKVYFTDGEGSSTAEELITQLACEGNCESEPVEVTTYGESTYAGETLSGVSKQTGRPTTYLILDLSNIDYTQTLVFETNSVLAQEFIDRFKLSATDSDEPLTPYSNQEYGFGFSYPENWELYELYDKTYAQVSAEDGDGLFSITFGGVNTEVDKTVKNEEVLIRVGEEVYTGVKRYYEAQDYYVVQVNVPKESAVYGIEYMYSDDKWTSQMDQILEMVWFTTPAEGSEGSNGAEYYGTNSVIAVPDVVYPSDGLRCGDGVMITGNIFLSNESGANLGAADGASVLIKVEKGNAEHTLLAGIVSDAGKFTVPSAILKQQLFSSADGSCSLDSLMLSLVAGTSQGTIWSAEYQNISKETVVETGVEGVVTMYGTGSAGQNVGLYANGTLISSVVSGSGGHFAMPAEPGEYQVRSGSGSVDVEVVSGVVSYVTLAVPPATLNGDGIGDEGVLPVQGAVVGVVHTNELFIPNTRVELYSGNTYLSNTRTDASGRFKFEYLEPGVAYDIRLPGKTVVLARWEVSIEGQHVLPDGGTLRVDVVVR